MTRRSAGLASGHRRAAKPSNWHNRTVTCHEQTDIPSAPVLFDRRDRRRVVACDRSLSAAGDRTAWVESFGAAVQARAETVLDCDPDKVGSRSSAGSANRGAGRTDRRQLHHEWSWFRTLCGGFELAHRSGKAPGWSRFGLGARANLDDLVPKQQA